MANYTVEQHVQMIKLYYQNKRSLVQTLRALRPFYGRRGGPSRSTLQRLVAKFERTGSVNNQPTPSRQRNARSTENIASVRESVQETPTQSISRRAQKLGLSQTSTWRILRRDLGLHSPQLKNNYNSFSLRKKVKMTDKPKRPISAYMMWLNSAREQIKAENPGMKVTEIVKKGGEIWKSMKDKSEWEEKAALAKEQYAKDLESYNANGGGGEGGGKKTQKRGKKRKKAAPAKSKKEESEDENFEEEEEGD